MHGPRRTCRSNCAAVARAPLSDFHVDKKDAIKRAGTEEEKEEEEETSRIVERARPISPRANHFRDTLLSDSRNWCVT